LYVSVFGFNFKRENLKNTLLKFMKILFASICLAQCVNAQLTISEVASVPSPVAIDNSATNAGSSLLSANNSKGQNVVFANTAHITGFIVRTHSVTTVDEVTLEIHAADGNGQPSGNALFSSSAHLPNTLVANDYIQFSFAQQDLLSGTYTFTLTTTDASFALKTSQGYAGGNLIRKNTSTNNLWVDTGGGATDLNFALLGTIDAAPPRPEASTGPNIIHIMVDDWGFTDHSVSALANGAVNTSDFYETPNIANLAAEGLSFTWSFTQPNCAPSRAAFMSGQYSPRSGNGVYNVASLNRSGSGNTAYLNAASQGGNDYINGGANAVPLAKAMYNAGYETCHIGKYHVGSGSPGNETHPLNQGIQHNYGGNQNGNPGNFIASGGTWGSQVGPELDAFAADYTQTYVDKHIKPFENGNDSDTLVGQDKHLTDAVVDAFESFMDTHKSGENSAYPVYVQFHFYATHTPLNGRSDLVAKYVAKKATTPPTHDTNNNFAALCENMDQSVGRIMRYLNDPNLDGDTSDSIADNTLVIFTSDNGGSESETENFPLRGRKGMHFEGGVRVPLIMRMPGTIPANKVTDTMVHPIDLYPTFLDFAADTANTVNPAATTHKLDGESIYAHSKDPDNVVRERSPIYYHFPGYMDTRAYASSAIIKQVDGKRYKFIYSYDPHYDPADQFDQYQLYNLTDDYIESVNLMDYIDVENSNDVEDPSDSREYWDYLLHKDTANNLAADLNNWLDPAVADPSWSPVYATYKSTYPGVAAGDIDQPTGPSPASVPELGAPSDWQFGVINVNVDNSNNLTVDFHSEDGFKYQLQVSESLENTSWVNLGPVYLAEADISQVILNDAANAGKDKRFYRVKLVK